MDRPDVETWQSLMYQQIMAITTQINDRLMNHDPSRLRSALAPFDEFIFALRDERDAVPAFLREMNKLAGALDAHLRGPNSQRDASEPEIRVTTNQQYDQINAFFEIVSKMRILRSHMHFRNELVPDVMGEMMAGVLDIHNRLPTSRYYWQADATQLRYFMENVLEQSIRDPFMSLPKKVFGSRLELLSEERTDDGGASASNTMLYVGLLAAAGALFYLNK